MWALVQDYLVIESEAEVDLRKKECSYSLNGDGLLCGAENYPLCKPVVNHNQQTIKAGRDREVGDQVARDLLEEVRGVGLNWSEWWDSGVGV